MTASTYDIAVIGAGAAGMMCAGVAAQRGRRVVLIDHATQLAEKIRISGGGRCNFTNRSVGPENFISGNSHFARSALSSYTPGDFIALVNSHGIAWHEKHRGQLFCDDSSELIIRMLRDECDRGGVHWRMPCAVLSVTRESGGFRLDTAAGPLYAAHLVIATGGLAIPQLGATDFGLKIARQFGLKVIDPRPALVPLTFDGAAWAPYAALSGVAPGRGVAASALSRMSFLPIAGCPGPGFCKFRVTGIRGKRSSWISRPGQRSARRLSGPSQAIASSSRLFLLPYGLVAWPISGSGPTHPCEWPMPRTASCGSWDRESMPGGLFRPARRGFARQR